MKTQYEENEIPHLIDIDIDDAMNRMMGNWTLYQRVLTTFCDNFHNTASQLETFIKDENWQSASELAHTIKGSGGNIGAKKLSAAAAILEQFCIKKDKNEAFVQQAIVGDLLRKVIDNKEIINKEKKHIPTEMPIKQDINYKEEIECLMLQLDSDIAEARLTLTKLQTNLTSPGGKLLLNDLENALNVFDIDTAKEIVDELKILCIK